MLFFNEILKLGKVSVVDVYIRRYTN